MWRTALQKFVSLQIPTEYPVGPKPATPDINDASIFRLDELMNMPYPLVRLASLIDWAKIERIFATSFTSPRGRPSLPARVVAGLLYLQHTFDASDDAVRQHLKVLWSKLPNPRNWSQHATFQFPLWGAFDSSCDSSVRERPTPRQQNPPA